MSCSLSRFASDDATYPGLRSTLSSQDRPRPPQWTSSVSLHLAPTFFECRAKKSKIEYRSFRDYHRFVGWLEVWTSRMQVDNNFSLYAGCLAILFLTIWEDMVMMS
ncbi:hypothetical protein RYX36_037000 [Vicia faba]